MQKKGGVAGFSFGRVVMPRRGEPGAADSARRRGPSGVRKHRSIWSFSGWWIFSSLQVRSRSFTYYNIHAIMPASSAISSLPFCSYFSDN
ncbi:MAG: hypothetical protein IJY89_05315, partial [Clostridia bacterium]|nr:hypothetical protein [Clostridia bacterium]